MNPIIEQHVNEIELRLIESPIVISYEVLRREIAPTDGKVRIKAMLSDGGCLEIFEYVVEHKGNLELTKYSFHWQDHDGRLRRRWDNAPHHPALPNAPHHVHSNETTAEGVFAIPTFFHIFNLIETYFS